MSMSFSVSKQIRPLQHIPYTSSDLFRHGAPKEKVVVVMGTTGAGKSWLSIDLATRFSAEIINSDKMQVYQGLDIATNKITDEERGGVPHHLLSVVDPESDFSAEKFRALAAISLRSILSRRQLPILVGGSNSFVEALVDVDFQSRYGCCFLWVDVAMPVLHSFVSDRVDKMVERGIVEEVRDLLKPNADYTRGIRRAIGVPEFDELFRVESFCDAETRARVLAEAIDSIKMNTGKLARRQLEKINRLSNIKGWRMHRLDATDMFRKRGGEAETAWKNMVVAYGEAIVSRILYDLEPVVCGGGARPLMA